MKIAYVITRADAVGGASVHVRDLSRAMLDRGHDIRVFVGGEGPVTEQLNQRRIPFHSLRHLRRAMNPVRDLLGVHELTAALREFAPDLVSTHTAKAGWIGRAACSRLGVPVIYTPHGWAISERISRGSAAVYTIAERIAAGWTDAIICVSEAERRLALEKRIAPPDVLHVVHNGVPDVGPELRACPAGRPVRIISLARFESPKDHTTLLQALERLRSLEWTLDLVGDGPLETQVQQLTTRLGLADRVRFCGYQVDPAPALAQAQLFVLSSRFEGFPRSILEAMRAGLPVVASDVRGGREAVADGEAGSVVPAGDIEAFSNGVKLFLDNDLRRQRAGELGHLLYRTRFQFEHMLAATEGVYATVVEKRQHRQTD